MAVLAAGIGGLLGLLGGAAGSRTDQTQKSEVKVGAESELERLLRGQQQGQVSDLQNLVNLGPGAQDVTSSLGASRGLASALQQAASTSGLPNANDIQQAQGFASQMFAPQQEQLNQLFGDRSIEVARLSAQLGRPVNDPILQAKLAQGNAREQSLLGAQQGAFAAQQAQQMPFQRLQLQSQLADVQGGLASQAFSNRQAILNMGNTLAQQERQFRLDTATRTGTQSQTSGGGLGGAIGGLFAGVGGGLSAARKLGIGGGNSAVEDFSGGLQQARMPG